MAGIFDAAKSGDAQLAATLLEGNKGLTAGYDENGWTGDTWINPDKPASS